ncbi:MAG: PolC-type DNA polymerase III [Metamycoplasmataceae bacterium]
MEEAFKKFSFDINWQIPKYLLNSTITNVESVVGNEFIIDVFFSTVPEIEDLSNFLKSVKNNFQFKTKLNIDSKIKNYNKELIYKYLLYGYSEIYQIDLKEKILFSSIHYDVSNNVLSIKAFDQTIYDFLVIEQENIINVLKKLGIHGIKCHIIDLSKSIDIDKVIEEENKELLSRFNDYQNQKNLNLTSSKNNSSVFYKKSFNSFYESDIQGIYNSYESKFVIEGKLITKNKIQTKTNLIIYSLLISDFKEAIFCKAFLKNEEEIKNYDSLKEEQDFLRIYGQKNNDINGAHYISISKLEIISPNNDLERKDLIDQKRTEFCVRTSMTSMDGFLSPTKFVETAKKFGHSSLAIVDKDSLQAFPEFYFSAKKAGIKPIYGVTLNVISRENEIIFNLKDQLIINETFVVFDIETTGLSPIFDEIIEFGAIKLKNNKIIERKQFFIKNTKKISDFTKNLTNITDEMLKNAISEKEAIQEILNFIQDSTLVAHNAKFDVSFLKEKMDKYGFGELKNQWIDSMALSWLLIEKSNSYKLEIVAKKTGIDYNSDVAHRADYDAEVLARIWVVFEGLLKTKQIHKFIDIKNVQESIFYERKRGDEVSFIAKNQQGLKEIFKLVSIAHTKSFFNQPKLFLEDIHKSDNVLIGSLGINSKLMNEIFYGTQKNINNELDFYDFIGVPNISLFSHKFHRQDIDKKDLSEKIKEIIYSAKQKNKLVIATGDVRYIDEKESILHEVYINAKALLGRRHYLWKNGEDDKKYPIQNFLTTKEMLEEFSFLNSEKLAFEIVVQNTQILNNLIDDNIEVIKNKLYTPNFDNSDEKLKDLVYENAYKIYGPNLPLIVEKRIQKELEPIIKYGFSVVYWISHKLVKKSLDDGYLVGSRGSVGSSLVATLVNITEVNPLPPHYICLSCHYSEFFENQNEYLSGFDLPDKNCPNCNILLKRDGQTIPFETFLGFEANKVPDIDLNFSGDYQSIIHQEVKNIFGENNVFRAGTISTVALKTAFGLAQGWNEIQPQQKSRAFVEFVANKIYGSKRTTGQHPGGIIIVPKEYEIEDFCPINYPANDSASDWKTTHFDFHAIHDNLLKLDLLGHDDPTAIRLLEKLTGINPQSIPFYDPKVISLFNSTEALGILPSDINGEKTGAQGIPEFGTRFVRKMLLVAKPKSFSDLVSISGLSHGTGVWKGNAEDLIINNNLTIKNVISCRDDIMVYLINKKLDPLYSFKIMESVRKGNGITADEEKELIKHNVPKWYIDSLKLIQYMFPKAHATAYVMMAWRVAWFKLYYPLEYYATFFSTRADFYDIDIMVSSKENILKKLQDIEKRMKNNEATAKEEKLIPIFEILLEMLSRGYKIENINLYESEATSWKIVKERKSLIPPFIVIDGLGIAAAVSIIKEREKDVFHSIQNLTKRTQLNKTNIEKLKSINVLKNLDELDQTSLF